MKLFTKTSLYYTAVTFFLFFAGSIVFYFYLKSIIAEDLEENIFLEKDNIIQYVNDSMRFPPYSVLSTDIFSYHKTLARVQETLKDTLLYNALEEEDQKYKQLVFPVKMNETHYAVTLSKPVFEADDLLDAIVSILGILAAVMLIVMFLLTRMLSKKMLQPLYETLEKLQDFDVNKTDTLHLPASTTFEFAALNGGIQKMTNKIQQDYQSMKKFNENASHEIQTPLAIIRSKLELIFQENNLPEEYIKPLQEIYASTNRLSKMNQAMLLLAKIENNQFYETASIDIKQEIEEKLQQLDELIHYKNISIEKKYAGSVPLRMNQHLCDILLSNLISNAIRHNLENGKILITLSTSQLSISNTGLAPDFPHDKAFERFRKSGALAESTGLGLAIVKQICDIYPFTITYSYAEGMHSITVQF